MIAILATIVFLFSLFVAAKDDFILLRRNVSLSMIFDASFFVGLCGLFFARLLYAFSHPSAAYFNPLVFFVIPYFPGLSAVGLFFGGSIALYVIAMRKKLPLGKLFDVFSLALLPSGGVFFLANMILTVSKKNYLLAIYYGVSTLVVFCLLLILQKFSAKFSWKDGSVALWSMSVLAGIFLTLSLALIQFRTLSTEFAYYVAFFFLLFLSFLLKTFKRTREAV